MILTEFAFHSRRDSVSAAAAAMRATSWEPIRFEFFVAGRYLRAKRKQAVISIITVISIVGVAAGVMALVIGIAINNGFRDYAAAQPAGRDRSRDASGEGSRGGNLQLARARSQAAQASACGQRVARSLRHSAADGPLGGSQSEGAELKGIPVDDPPDILQHLKQGSFEKLKNTSGLPGIILGARLAQNTGMLLHSVVNVISPQGELTPFGPQLRRRYQFRVVGSSNPDFMTSTLFGRSPR